MQKLPGSDVIQKRVQGYSRKSAIKATTLWTQLILLEQYLLCSYICKIPVTQQTGTKIYDTITYLRQCRKSKYENAYKHRIKKRNALRIKGLK